MTVPIHFVNEEGKTEFHTNVGDTSIANGVNWSVTVHEMPDWAASSVEFHTTQNLKVLDIQEWAEAIVVQNGSRALVVNGLNIAPGGTLDMKDNDLVVHAAPGTRDDVFAVLYAWIVEAYSNGTWLGTGLTSTVARDNTTRDTGLGVAKNAELAYTTFTTQAINSDSILVKYTYYEDIELDGDVDANDEATFMSNYGKTGL